MQVSRRALLFAVAGAAFPQEPKFSADVDVVTLFATVRDARGLFVKNLERSDFQLFDNGIPQTIRYFSRETNLPLKIGILVDTSQSQEHVLAPERDATYTFLQQVLREREDQAFIAHFDVRVEVLQPFSSSRKNPSAALGRLEVPKKLSTLLYDAIRDCSEKLMRPIQGRKAFILLSDGVDFRSKTQIGTAIEYAQRADAMIFSILFAESLRPTRPLRSAVLAMQRDHGKHVMQRLAGETGGAYFEVTQQNPIGKIYAEIEDILRNQYSLGYSPEPNGAPGAFRKIQLTTGRPGLTVKTRAGYYR